MQLNVNVPKDRESLMDALDEAVGEHKITKSQLVLDAVEHYLADLHRGGLPGDEIDLPTFELGVIEPLRRADAYEEHLDEKLR
jgi:hypothetical protein